MVIDGNDSLEVFEADLPSDASDGADLLECVVFGIAGCDAEGALTRVNSVLESLTGWPAGELIGRQISELYEPESVETVGRLLGTVLQGGKTVEVEMKVQGRSGPVLVRVAAVGRFGPPRTLREVIWTIRQPDPVPLATGGVRAEWLAGALSDAASEFSGFRPAFEDGLRAALLVVESTPGWTRDLKDVHSKLGTAISGLKRFTQDVSSLERLVAERPLQLGAVDPSGCVERAAKLAARLLRAGRIRLKNDIPEPPPPVRADEDRLTEAFLLLLISCRDVLRKGKDASTDDSTISRRRTIHVELGSLPPWIQILVSNNGPAVLTHPVEEFRSLGRSTLNRAGLRGVAEAAEILRSLGGGLIYQPLGEKGNRFILTLKKG